MFSKILRKFSNFVRIPFTFKNWAQVIGYCSIYSKNNIRFVILRSGERLKIRFINTYDIGSILETWSRKVYLPSHLSLPAKPMIIDIGASIGDFSIYCASSFPGAKIMSFEPTDDAVNLLREIIWMTE